MPRKHEEEIRVTDQNFGDLLIESLREARAISKGKLEPARRVRRTVGAREPGGGAMSLDP